ncbi:hypothetical protein M413DRAFT_449526 [Hebeloma cylindrosporum]|uniref:MPN domain-containing protein n=1 Tax=Hebeloma cylindrosporum TaxID=76867 RepID=A0A0C2Y4A2_HEBCY|nr:hypothetical protein M413DRAFT_449526 [Hebeloma cylindrosporum h7]
MTTPSYTISAEAYYKIFFHTAKHPHQPVNGVLVGTQERGGNSQATHGSITIADAVPLLHHWTSLSPMMEIGLDLATQHAESMGMKVVGYYQACERLDDTALAPVGEKVAGKVKASFPDAVAFVIDNQKLGTMEGALIPYIAQTPTSNWRPVPPTEFQAFTPGSKFQFSDPSTPVEAVRLVQEHNLHFAFGDFDDHLEDVTIDWLRNRSCLP